MQSTAAKPTPEQTSAGRRLTGMGLACGTSLLLGIMVGTWSGAAGRSHAQGSQVIAAQTQPATVDTLAARSKGKAIEKFIHDFAMNLSTPNQDLDPTTFDFDQWLSRDRLFERVFAPFKKSDAGPGQIRELPADFVAAQWLRLTSDGKLGRLHEIIDAVKNGGSYEFLDARTKNDANGAPQMVALFRLIKPESGGVNYHDYVLAHVTNVGAIAVDIFDYSAGEDFSETIRRNLVLIAFDKLPPSDDQSLYPLLWASRRDVESLRTAFAADNFAQVLSIYAGMDPRLQQDQAMLIDYLISASKVKEYYPAFRSTMRSIEMRDSAAMRPTNPALLLLGIDGYLRMKDCASAQDCVVKLQQALQITKEPKIDPYLNVILAGINDARLTPEGTKITRDLVTDWLKTIQAPKNFEFGGRPATDSAFWWLMSATVKDQNYKATADVLKSLNDSKLIQKVHTLPELIPELKDLKTELQKMLVQ